SGSERGVCLLRIFPSQVCSIWRTSDLSGKREKSLSIVRSQPYSKITAGGCGWEPPRECLFGTKVGSRTQHATACLPMTCGRLQKIRKVIYGLEHAGAD